LQTLKRSLLLRNALVQVLALKLCKLCGEQPCIALNIPPMAQNFSGTEVSHRRHLVEMVKRCPSGWGGEFAANRNSAAE
jgi:hypothetical protein